MKSIVRVICAADGRKTPHDGRYVVAWNPHTPAGELELTSSDNPHDARQFAQNELWDEWRAISNVQPKRPWDGMPNRPLTGLNLDIIHVEALDEN